MEESAAGHGHYFAGSGQAGVPEEIASDQGSTLVRHATEGFLKNWGVKQMVSSAHFPPWQAIAKISEG